MRRRLGALLLATVLLASGLWLGMPAAVAGRRLPHPCDIARRSGEKVQNYSKRLIRCAVGAYGPVKGGVRRAICIAKRESGLIPTAESPTGQYLGLFQHSKTYWKWRFDTYTQPSWKLSPSALSGRTNSMVTVRMVHAFGGWRAAGWPVWGC